jgi:nickel/cobalt exporter
MPRRRTVFVALAIVAMALIFFSGRAPAASAHPLGNFTINHYDRIEVSDMGISVYSVLDMAEIPAFQEHAKADANGDGTVDDAERAAYARSKAGELLAALALDIDGRPVALHLESSDVKFPPGQAGLPLVRLTVTSVAALPAGWRGPTTPVRFSDGFLPNRLGWREVVVRGSRGARVCGASVAETSVTAELTQYPADALSTPLDVRSASFSVADAPVCAAGAAPPPSAPATSRAITGNTDSPLSRFADLVAKGHLSAEAIVVALLAAMGFGAIHALSPGHGKTVVAAYLVGSRGTLRHALLLGLTVTLTHTASVYALGFVTLYLSAYIVPERLYPWLGIASGGLIVTMGLSLLYGRLRSSGLAGAAWRWLRRLGSALGLRPASAGGEAGMVLLSRGARLYGRGEHQARARHHGPGGHGHGIAARPHRHGPGQPHSHAIPGTSGDPVTWRQLIGLGVFGGMLPCPSAIVVMLSAISLHRVGFGLMLIVAFSLGLAGVLSGIGFALVFARRLSSRVPLVERIVARAALPRGSAALAVRLFPSASAAAVVAAGAAILFRALAQQGLV